MGSFSLFHWIVVMLVIVLLFGGGRISGLMGDVAKGIKAFKKGMSDDDETPAPRSVNRIEGQPTPDASATAANEEQKQG
ncbi:MAG: twin-arginine translocase TatA/TatE family subunit [Sphingobium sp.]